MKLLLLLLAVTCSAYSYKILGIFPTPTHSHAILSKGIVDSLLNAGHQVSWASPYSHWKPHPNLTLIDITDNEKLIRGVNMMSHENAGLKFMSMISRKMTQVTVESKELRQAIISEQFDAVVTEWLFSDTDAGYAAILQVPWIQGFGTGITPNVELQVDELRSTSTIPLLHNSFPVPMDFFQRVTNTFTTFLVLFMDQFLVQILTQVKAALLTACSDEAFYARVERDDAIQGKEKLLSGSSPSARYESYFAPLAAARGVPLPPYSDAYYNVSIQFVNSHPSIGYAQSLPPNVIDIAGYHIEEPEPLPKDIQALLDSSPQGVVFFSMGSVLKSAMIPEHTRSELIAVLGALPYTVLWKFEEELQGLPSNIIVKKWWPQSAVLAHPNIKLFITHGGMLSTLEAVKNGIPLLTIPVFGDQPSNAARAEQLGYSLSVPFSVDMAPALKVALNEMLSTDRFYKQAKFLSRIFNNRPVHPSKLISHYVELAIESKGAYHLRSKTHLYPWYQRWMLDQLAALAALLYALYALLRALLRAVFTKKDSKKVKRN